ncbi:MULTISPECIES: hypothetical protein [unclassified Bacillus (in: firmicutes)]|nr:MULTISPECIES: hypothetical protein [unclassified Bacillus (in: firmicutes)]PFG12260.1 hypothetical protein ATG70_0437 [Bacillus sp. es.036]
MVFKNVFHKELTCSNCHRVLKSGDDIYVHLTLPNEKKMPVGVLDQVLRKHSEVVYCKTCYK